MSTGDMALRSHGTLRHTPLWTLIDASIKALVRSQTTPKRLKAKIPRGVDGLESLIVIMKASGLSNQSIALRIVTLTGIEVSHEAIRRWAKQIQAPADVDAPGTDGGRG